VDEAAVSARMLRCLVVAGLLAGLAAMAAAAEPDSSTQSKRPRPTASAPT
jgi:hypothetical protein